MNRKNKNRLAAILLALSLAVPVLSAPREPVQATAYKVGPTYTSVSFTIMKWVVFKEEGQFHDFTGNVIYDPKNPAACKVEVVVQATSIDTRNGGRDKVLRSSDFFDVEKYPTLEFHSTSVAAKDKDTLEVTGDLTIHGMTRRVDLPVKILGVNEVEHVGKLAGFETTFTIDRADYGVLGFHWGNGKLILSKEVTIHILLGAVAEYQGSA